jgi:hypothetical protein
VAVQTSVDGRPRHIRLRRIARFKQKWVKSLTKRVITEGATVATDGLKRFRGATDAGAGTCRWRRDLTQGRATLNATKTVGDARGLHGHRRGPPRRRHSSALQALNAMKAVVKPLQVASQGVPRSCGAFLTGAGPGNARCAPRGCGPKPIAGLVFPPVNFDRFVDTESTAEAGRGWEPTNLL